MDTHKIKQLADDIAAVGRAEAWLEEYGEATFNATYPRYTATLDFATGMSGHAEAQNIVQTVVNSLGEEILNAALALCASKHRELTDALRAEIVS